MDFPSFSLKGKKALVTGGSSGIGYHAALSLADAGCEVLVTGRNRRALEEAAAEIRKMGVPSHFLVADLAETQQAIQMAREADKILKGVDLLVNNAGITFPEPALETTLEHWNTTLAVNLTAPMFICQQIVPGMIQRRYGKIIMIGSVGGIISTEDHAAYSSSKGGMILLTKAMAIEWARYNINVNLIAPAVILTPMGEKVWGAPEKREPKIAATPQGRLGVPLDVSGVVLFLASPASDYLNGATIPVDGGFLTR